MSLPLTDRLAIEALVVEHSFLIDHGRAGSVADLYTEDARVLGIGALKEGRAAIGAWAAEREAMTDRRSRHVLGNLRLQAVSSDTVRGTVVLTLYRHDGAGDGSASPFLIGEYEDVLRRSADRWLFAERRLSVLFGG